MSYRNREIESKWIVRNNREDLGRNPSLGVANQVLHEALGASVRSKITGRSTDWYWTVPGDSVVADFIRLRDVDGSGKYQITVKGKDKGVNENRLEVDIDTTSSLPKILKLLQSTFGPAAGEVTKEYHVYWPTPSEHLTISCYQVEGSDIIYIEVEATSASSLDEWEGLVSSGFEKYHMSMDRAPGSLYEMYILPGVGGMNAEVSENK